MAGSLSGDLSGLTGLQIRGVVVLSTPEASQKAAIALGEILQTIVDTHRKATSSRADGADLAKALLTLSNVESKGVELAGMLQEIPTRCPFPDIKPDLEEKCKNLLFAKTRMQNAFKLQREGMVSGGQLTKESVLLVFKEVFGLIESVVQLLMANDAVFRKICEHTVIETLKWLRRVKEYTAASDPNGEEIKTLATEAGTTVTALVRKLNNRVFALEDNEPETADQLRAHMEVLKTTVASVVQLTQAAATNIGNEALRLQRHEATEKFGAAAAAAHALSKHPATLQCIPQGAVATNFKARSFAAVDVVAPDAQQAVFSAAPEPTQQPAETPAEPAVGALSEVMTAEGQVSLLDAADSILAEMMDMTDLLG